MTDLDAYAVCAPGLESLVAEELAGLGLEVAGTERGGVALRTDLAGLYRANLHSRLATRILLRLAAFRTRTFADLAARTADLPWDRYLAPATPVAVKAASRASRLYILKRIKATVAVAIAGRVGTTRGKAPTPRAFPLPPAGGRRKMPAPPWSTPPPPPPGEGRGGGADDSDKARPPQQVLVRLVNNQCTISLDTSGELLHRRGYRLATAKAPLRETLACAVLHIARWRPDMPLLDPFCGAGTFAIEAARWALGIPPGWDRPFAFHAWPTFDGATWEKLRNEAAVGRLTLPAPITAADRDPGAVRTARDNARRAGVADLVTIDAGDFFDRRPAAAPGLIVINAPYGRRVGHGDLNALYRRLGCHLRDRYRGWTYAVLCGNTALGRATGLTPDQRRTLFHGGRHIPVLHGRL